MGIGKKGEAVTPYDSWQDKRCEDSWEELRAFGEDEIISITGVSVTYAHGSKILWWKNQPDAMGKSQGRLAKPRGASEKFWIFPVGFRSVSPA